MAQRGYVICSVDEKTGQVQVQAIVTEPKDGLNPKERAADIAERLALVPGQNPDLKFFVAEADANATNWQMGLLENLGEQNGDDFVNAALLTLNRLGVVQIPQWLSTIWVAEELRTRHNIRTRMEPGSRLLRIDTYIPRQNQGPSEDDGFQETRGLD